jgi:ribonucleotide reductase alpha subunit
MVLPQAAAAAAEAAAAAAATAAAAGSPRALQVHTPTTTASGSPERHRRESVTGRQQPQHQRWHGRRPVQKVGIRNSLLTALMPTASTSQILGNIESFEPMTTNIYSRKTSAGTFILINKYLIDDLKKINLWNNDIKNEIISNRGSILNISYIPDNLKIRIFYKDIYTKHLLNTTNLFDKDDFSKLEEMYENLII